MGLIAIIAFWVVIIRLWIVDGAKIPLIFIGLWLLGGFGFPRLGLSAYLFMSFEAALTIILIIIERCKSVF
jgi:hypothetical protein